MNKLRDILDLFVCSLIFFIYYRSIKSGHDIGRYSESNDSDSDSGAKKPDRDIPSRYSSSLQYWRRMAANKALLIGRSTCFISYKSFTIKAHCDLVLKGFITKQQTGNVSTSSHLAQLLKHLEMNTVMKLWNAVDIGEYGQIRGEDLKRFSFKITETWTQADRRGIGQFEHQW